MLAVGLVGMQGSVILFLFVYGYIIVWNKDLQMHVWSRIYWSKLE